MLIGRHHWPGLLAMARADEGGRAYLLNRQPNLVECGDLATGRDVDHPGQWPGLVRPPAKPREYDKAPGEANPVVQ